VPVLYCAVLCCTVLYLYFTVLCRAVLCCLGAASLVSLGASVLESFREGTVLYCTALYCTVTVLYLYCTVLYL